MAHAGGRPSKYDPKFCEEAIDYIGHGKSKEAFAGHIGVSKETLYSWMKEHQEFVDALKIADAMSRDFWEEMGIVGMTEGKYFNATTWIFNMKNRFGWRDAMEYTGAKGKDLFPTPILADVHPNNSNPQVAETKQEN